MRRAVLMLLTLIMSLALASVITPTAGAAQMQLSLATRGPHFLYSPTGSIAHAKPIDASRAPVLQRRIAVELDGATLEQALRTISDKAGLKLAYSRDALELQRPIHLRAAEITVAAALTAVLLDANVDIVFSRTGQAMLVKRQPDAMRQQAGAIVGTVTDAKTGEGVVGAQVTIDGTGLGAMSGDSGQYRIAGVAVGRYTVTAKRLGYERASQEVMVAEGQDAVVDFALAVATTMLDQVVVTGTIVPTAVKALPNPISVITESQIAEQHPRTLGEMLREVVPGMVAWDAANFPDITSFSVRGAASLSGSSMKVYLDGIEVASRNNAAVDPTSIARIEVIRGPQAATMYGSDAIGGVIQIFTKRGDTTDTRPRIDARTGWGAVQTSYAQSKATLRQEYSAAVRGGTPNVSYNLGGSYTHLGDWIPEGAQSIPSIYGGIRVEQGQFTFDISGRSYNQQLHQTASPLAAATGYPVYSKPFYTISSSKEQGFGGRATWQTTPWLHQNVTIGVDRFIGSSRQERPRLVSPVDTLLSLENYSNSKTFLAYNVSLSGAVAPNLAVTLTGGVDHYDLTTDDYYTSGATQATGAVITDPLQPIVASLDDVTNTGYFGQLQATLWSDLTLTAGVRAEQNSAIGANIGAPVSPRVGLAYAKDLGRAAVKLRASYGEAILPPSPIQTQGRPLGGGAFQLANPNLRPQRQGGWDAGVDVVLGSLASASITYYDQTARDLIQFVVVTPPFLEYQSQNAGRIRNRGVELEGTLDVGLARLTGQFAATDSRVAALSSSYGGDLRVGDRPLLMPKYTAGATLALTPWRKTTITAGLKYVGAVRNYDAFAQLSCAAGTAPCLPVQRDYLITYPGFTKIDLGVTHELTPWISTFLSIQNVGNNTAIEQNGTVPIMGRTTMAGMEVHY